MSRPSISAQTCSAIRASRWDLSFAVFSRRFAASVSNIDLAVLSVMSAFVSALDKVGLNKLSLVMRFFIDPEALRNVELWPPSYGAHDH